ncbi:MAG: thiopeptide-type bacteriocin biosynthesis protein [Prevotellaceae bacterium]|nr:thiopeptide-type bacteriocin biosynthesis protein [Prevotellaceae bacterium]
MSADIQRTFMPGDQWLYVKIYTGFNTADRIIIEIISPLANQLLNNQVIGKWFFIRYSDPELHLRLRLLLNDNNKINIPILMLQQALREYIVNDLVWKVQIDTYQREVERYGATTVELSETLFFYDSQCFTEILQVIQGPEAEMLRWLSAMASVDYLLNDFSFDLQQKVEFITMVKENFVREFGLENSRSQLSNKFRSFRNTVEEFLEANGEKYQNIHTILAERSKWQTSVADQIIRHTDKGEKLNSLLSSYSHMMMNRWFRSKQRMHEAVVYDFLLKYYKSKMARII